MDEFDVKKINTSRKYGRLKYLKFISVIISGLDSNLMQWFLSFYLKFIETTI